MARSVMPKKILWLNTTRYSPLCRRILEEYARTAAFVVDGKEYKKEDIPTLLTTWCTNRMIRGTRDFRVVLDGVEIFGFHDSPRDFWATETELPFLEKMAAEKIARYEVPRTHTPARAAAAGRRRLGRLLLIGLVTGLVAFALWRIGACE